MCGCQDLFLFLTVMNSSSGAYIFSTFMSQKANKHCFIFSICIFHSCISPSQNSLTLVRMLDISYSCGTPFSTIYFLHFDLKFCTRLILPRILASN